MYTRREKKGKEEIADRMRMNLQEERSIPSSSRGLRGISDLFCGYWRRNVGFLKRSGGVVKWIFAGVFCGSDQGSQEDEQIKEEEMKIMRGNRKGGEEGRGRKVLLSPDVISCPEAS